MAADTHSRLRGHGPLVLTEFEAGRRNRRAVDAVLLGVMALLTSLAATIAHSAPDEDQAVGQAMVTILGWTANLCRASVLCALGLSAVILVVITVRRRWALLRDVVLALVVLAATGSIVGRIVGPDWLAVDNDLWSRWGFPEYRLAAAIAIATVAGPELVGPVRALLSWLVVAAGVGQLALGSALPSDVLGAVALGLGAGALIRLVFGSAAGVPPSAEVRDSMLDSASSSTTSDPWRGRRWARRRTPATTATGILSASASSDGTPRTPSGSRAGGACWHTAIRLGARRSGAWNRSNTRHWPR